MSWFSQTGRCLPTAAVSPAAIIRQKVYLPSCLAQVAEELLCARTSDLPDATKGEESRRRQEKRQPEMPVGVVQVAHRFTPPMSPYPHHPRLQSPVCLHDKPEEDGQLAKRFVGGGYRFRNTNLIVQEVAASGCDS